jgi:hypothetical protein
MTEHAHAAGGALLRELAESLFGAEGTTAVAAALGLNRRTVLRWLNGQNAVPTPVWRELAGMLELRQAAIAELRREVEAMLQAGVRAATEPPDAPVASDGEKDVRGGRGPVKPAAVGVDPRGRLVPLGGQRRGF